MEDTPDGTSHSQRAGSGPSKSVRLRIEGHVQGVGFRYWTLQAAVGLGLTGFVRNRRDGGVEASLHGPSAGVDDMIGRCHKGPRGALVARVEVLAESDPPPLQFDVAATV